MVRRGDACLLDRLLAGGGEHSPPAPNGQQSCRDQQSELHPDTPGYLPLSAVFDRYAHPCSSALAPSFNGRREIFGRWTDAHRMPNRHNQIVIAHIRPFWLQCLRELPTPSMTPPTSTAPKTHTEQTPGQSRPESGGLSGMFLKTLRLSNFRSCYDTRVSFRPTLTLLVGENNSGKSNIIEALRLATTTVSKRSTPRDSGRMRRPRSACSCRSGQVRTPGLTRNPRSDSRSGTSTWHHCGMPSASWTRRTAAG